MAAVGEQIGDHGPLVLDLHDAAPAQDGDLGDAGAALADLRRLGVPAPAGFVITTRACDSFVEAGYAPDGLWTCVSRAMEAVERRSGLRLGDPTRPLLLTVAGPATLGRDPVEGVGMTDDVLAGLEATGAGPFARATYAVLLRGYARTVLGVDSGHLHDPDVEPRGLLRDLTGEDLPQDPMAQLRRCVDALVQSCRAELPTAAHRSGHCGAALTVVQLVTGDRDDRSGVGVACTRDPSTGAPGVVGEFLTRMRRFPIDDGPPAPLPLSRLRLAEPAVHAELVRVAGLLEKHRRDVRELDFVVDRGRLWVLGDRPASRSAPAAFRIAASLVDEGLIDLDEALTRVDGPRLATLVAPVHRPGRRLGPGIRAVGTSPGTATGDLALDSATALLWAAQGRAVVLALEVPRAGDDAGVKAAQAVVTGQRGRLTRTAGLTRELGIPCVSDVEGMTIDPDARLLTLPGGLRLAEGAVVSVDGATGQISAGRWESRPSPVANALHGLPAATSPRSPVIDSVLRLVDHADARRRLEIHANAETPEEARIARRLGAQGIGLCRTENLLLGPRRELMERLVTDEERDGALETIEAFTYTEFTSILEAMDGLPVVVRLLDPPLQEFLPDLVDLSVETALAAERAQVDERQTRRLLAVRRLWQSNPLLGLRGVRILTVLPQITDMQVRALARATVALRSRGLHPRPQVMIPLVADVSELAVARARVERVIAEVARAHHVELDLPVGVMIELPRAALTAAALAGASEFFSFGTNDLTQTCWGISQDDAEATFLKAYREAGILTWDPFVTIDENGVGRLVRLAAHEGRAANPGLRLGASGRHAEDPASVGFFARAGLDYLSCSPLRIPIIRLEAGRQAVLDRAGVGHGAAPEEGELT